MGAFKDMTQARDDERLVAAQLLQALREIQAQMTEQFGRWLGRIQNDTLAVETRVFPANGIISLAFRSPAGSIMIDNPAVGTTITVVSSGPDAAAPTQGTGVYVVPAASIRTIAVASRQITLYGTATARVSFQVFTIGVRPTT